MLVVHIDLGKSHQSKSIGLLYAIVVELFTVHLSQKNQDFIIFSGRNISEINVHVNIFSLFFVIRKNVSFHIVTKRDSLSRVFINLVVDKKIYALLFQTKKYTRLSLFGSGVIHENVLKGLLEHPVFI